MTETSTLASLLRDVVRDDLWESPDERQGELLLRECDAEMNVRIDGLTPSCTVVRIGRLQHLKGIDKGKWKKICDYLLAINDDQQTWIVLIEMKKSLSNATGAEEQLRRSIPVARYLQSICECESQVKMPISLRYILLAEKYSSRFDKERTRTDAGTHSSITKHKGIAVKTIVGHSVSAEDLLAVEGVSGRRATPSMGEPT